MNGYFDKNQPGSLSWLMSLDDASFIEGVYNVVMGRQADPVGTEHYLRILKKKRGRLQVISALYHSKEARKQPQRQDVTDAVFNYRHPIRSRLVNAFKPQHYASTDSNSVMPPPLTRSHPAEAMDMSSHQNLLDAVYGKGNALFDAVHGKGNALMDQLLKLEYRLDHAEAVEAEDVLGDGNTRYIFNLSSSNHWRSHPVGIIRVEREIATYLLRFRNVDYVLWDAQSQCLRKLSRIHADRILAPEWCDPEAALIPYDPAHMREAAIKPNDIYISMGLDWDHAPTSQVFKYLKQLGAKSILTCFDTVPVQFPEFLVRDEIGQEFRQHLVEMAHSADKVWAISQATGKDLARFWQDAWIERSLPEIITVPLASYTDTTRLPTLDSRDHAIMRDVFSKGDYVLYVSSVEPRKNHKLMFDIWRDLWNERGANCPQFVFVGAVGWGCSDTIQRVSRMAAYTGGKVNGLHRVSDNLLQHLYHNSSFTVFPSLYEGWGLAATEAMQHGKVCVVANNSSLGEATQGLMPALHPLDFPGWKAEIERLLDDVTYRRSLEEVISKQYQSLTWNDIGERFCNEVILGHYK